MQRSLYTATCGMLVSDAVVQTVANNLANVNTTAFKKDRVAIKAYPQKDVYRIKDKPFFAPPVGLFPQYIGKLSTGAAVDEVATDFTRGPMKVTDNKLDFYIDGDSFFLVRDRNGKIYFTRDGRFKLGPSGVLLTRDGLMVMGLTPPAFTTQGNVVADSSGKLARNAKPISLSNLKNFSVAEDGTINGSFPNGMVIMIVKVNPKYLKKIGKNLYTWAGPKSQFSFDKEARLIQGAVELSNVNAVEEMTRMIQSFRMFEINQKVITTTDAMNDKIINASKPTA